MAGSPFKLIGGRIVKADRSAAWGAQDAPVTHFDKTLDFIVAASFYTSDHGGCSGTLYLFWQDKTDGSGFGILGAAGELTYNGVTDLVDGNGVTHGEEWIDNSGYANHDDGTEFEGSSGGAETLSDKDTYHVECQWAVDPSNADNGHEYEFQIWDNTAGAAVSTLLCTVTMAQVHALVGASGGGTSVSGILTVTSPTTDLAGTSDGVATASAILSAIVPLAATSGGGSTASAVLTVTTPTTDLAGTSDGQATAQADADVTFGLAATSGGIATAQAALTVDSYQIKGVTYDKAGGILGSCELWLFKDNLDDTLTYIAYTTSNGGTGAYLFQHIPDNDAQYLVRAWKDDAPHVFDVTDHVLLPKFTPDTDYDLYLRSDADKGEVSPDTDLRLRSQADKLGVTHSLVGSSAGQATASAVLIGVRLIAATSDGAATAVAVLNYQAALAATSAGGSTAIGALSLGGEVSLAATSAGGSTAIAAMSLGGEVDLVGSSAGSSTASAVLNYLAALAGSSAGGSTATAVLSIAGEVALAGSSGGAATVGASLNYLAGLAGTAQGLSTCTAAMTRMRAMQAASAGQAVVVGSLNCIWFLSVTSSGLSIVTGSLTFFGVDRWIFEMYAPIEADVGTPAPMGYTIEMDGDMT